LDTFVDTMLGMFGFGKSAEQQLMDEMAHLAVVDLENPFDYQVEVTPEEMQAYGRAWGGYETSPYDLMGDIGAEVSAGGWGSPGGLDIGGEGPSGGGTGPGGTGGGPGGGPGTGGGVGDDAGSPF
jgi:hypothetical protein